MRRRSDAEGGKDGDDKERTCERMEMRTGGWARRKTANSRLPGLISTVHVEVAAARATSHRRYRWYWAHVPP